MGRWKVKTIYKYEIPFDDEFKVNLPTGAEIVSVQSQHNTPHMWCIVETTAPTRPTSFILHGTGHPMNGHEGKHLASFQINNGSLVFHLFEDTRR